jgi:chemotaxis protein CheD
MTEMKVSEAGVTALVTEMVSAAVVVCLYDAYSRIGALVHPLLPRFPEGTGDEGVGRFVDSAVSRAVERMVAAGAEATRIAAGLSGAADVFSFADDCTQYSIGGQNAETAREVLRELRIPVQAEELGGHLPRTVTLQIDTGALTTQVPGKDPKEVAVLRGGSGVRKV